jgi:hypothetical protein
MTLHYLVDTDWAIHYLHGHGGIIARLEEFQDEGVGLSPRQHILYLGAHGSRPYGGLYWLQQDNIQNPRVRRVRELDASKRKASRWGRNTIRTVGRTSLRYEMFIFR